MCSRRRRDEEKERELTRCVVWQNERLEALLAEKQEIEDQLAALQAQLNVSRL